MSFQPISFLSRYYGNVHAAKVLHAALLLFVALIGIQSSGVNSAYVAAIEVGIAAVAIIVAEDYAELIGFTVKNGRALNAVERREIFEDTLAVATFCVVPVIILLASNSGWYNISTAFDLAYAFCISVLFIFSYFASRLSRHSKLRALATAITAACIGCIIIFIKFTFSK